MSQTISPEIRKLLWSIMIDEKMATLAKEKGVAAVATTMNVDLSPEDLNAVGNINIEDVTDLLAAVERDLTLVMGGSRPRRSMALSDGAIRELQDALKDVRRTDE